MTTKISIITPLFNSETTLDKTIGSVLSQNQDCNLEYIVVDGGSTDRSLAILENYRDRIDVLISEPDFGAYDAMNKGIARATGEVVGIINSDDWYNDSALERVNREFEQNPEIDVLYSPIDNYYEGKFVATFVPGSLDKLPIRFTLNHPSCFIRKSAYEKVGLYDLKYRIAADYDLVLRLFTAGLKFHYTNFSLASYSLGGMSSSPIPKHRIQLIRECWQVSSSASGQHLMASSDRAIAYTRWVANECFALPTRYFFKPPMARKIKMFFTQHVGKFVPDTYGKW